MHVPFRIHYRNNLIDKKDSYPIPRPPSWDDHNCSYGHQLYHSEYIAIHNCIKYIDILFGAQNIFLEYLHHSKTMESQII
jgi:hypothetical protein